MKSSSRIENIVKVFGMSNQLISEDLARIERDYDVQLGHVSPSPVQEENRYYSQFDLSVRLEASAMARNYEIFYCLEKSIRELISDTMEEADGDSWWSEKRVPQVIYQEVSKRIKKDRDTGMTMRSSDPLDFTTFGELSSIIASNWDLFGGILKNQRAVERIMGQLNSLRGPIAHCSPLAEDEVLRLQITLRDWFRQME